MTRTKIKWRVKKRQGVLTNEQSLHQYYCCVSSGEMFFFNGRCSWLALWTGDGLEGLENTTGGWGGFSILLLVVWRGYEEIAGAQQRFRGVVENKHLRHETDWGLLVQHKKQLVYYSPEAGSQNIRSCGWLILSQDGQQLIGASPFWTHKNLSQEKDTPSTHNFFILHSISYVSAAIL